MQVGEDAPDMFLMDIQADQRAGVTALIDRENGAGSVPRLIPVLRARITGVRGRDVNLESYEDVRDRGGLSREFTITYRSTLEANEKLVDGKWWDDPARRQISPKCRSRRAFASDSTSRLGDEMRFDVLGRIVSARGHQLSRSGLSRLSRRRLHDRLPARPVRRPPRTASSPRSGAERTRPRERVCRVSSSPDYPNISVIDLREVLDTVKTIVDNVTLAVTVVGALVLLSGSLILIGAVSMTKFRRVYEAAILKTLGASSRLIATMLLLEYGVLGAIAGTVGAAGAVGPELGSGPLRTRPAVGTGAVADDRGNRGDRDRRRGDRRDRQSRRFATQAAVDAPRRVGVECPLVPGDKRPLRREATRQWTSRLTGTRCSRSAGSS